MKAINESVNKANFDYPYIGIGTKFDNSPLHFHGELEILLVDEGEILATVEAESFRLSKGDICVIFPWQIHTLYKIGQIRLFVLKLLPGVSLRGLALQSSVIHPSDAHYEELFSEIHRIVCEDEKRERGYQLAVRCACDTLTLTLLRFLSLPSQKGDATSFGQGFFESVCDYIEKNYKRAVTLDGACAAFGYSRSYFSRLFKSVCGMNFFDYLAIFRLKKSTELLRDKSLTIEGIALASGYNCLRSYNRAFLKYFGQSPGSYRKSLC